MTGRTLVKILIAVLVLLLCLPLIMAGLSRAFPSKSLDRAMGSGALRWEPVSGVIIERPLPEHAWEQEIIGWNGPGMLWRTVKDSNGNTEMRKTLVWVELEYSFSRATNRTDFYFYLVSGGVAGDNEMLAWLTGKKFITGPGEAKFYFAPDARIRLAESFKWAGRELAAGTDLTWDGQEWGTYQGGDRPLSRKEILSRGGSFTFRLGHSGREPDGTLEVALMSAVNDVASRGPEPQLDVKPRPAGESSFTMRTDITCELREERAEQGSIRLEFEDESIRVGESRALEKYRRQF